MIPAATAVVTLARVARVAHTASHSSFWQRVAEACAPIVVGISLSTAAGMLRRWHKRRMRQRDREEGVERKVDTLHTERIDEGVVFTIDGASVLLSHEQVAELAAQITAADAGDAGDANEPEPAQPSRPKRPARRPKRPARKPAKPAKGEPE